ncbi:sulfonate ABC transporter substrate-binding protein [Paenibacillus sp. S-12]|uniref:sulfonate ABC transporter substrate-binding protein n=1 Tax=unclassified Paenibacillus TaxID=185978 RepID=UPI0025A2E6A3|nr:sulfonate ABC transporter substrate-binding protein [Paenibacillus sp. S-12]
MSKDQLYALDNLVTVKAPSEHLTNRQLRVRVVIILISWFCLMALLAGCASVGAGTGAQNGAVADTSGAGKNGSRKVIRIGYQKGNTLNILKVNGNLDKRLKEAGYEVEWKVFAGGNFLLEALSSGSIDFGHAADGSGVFAQAGNKPFVYVGNDHPNPEGMGIVTYLESGVQSIADLKGKKLAVGKGGNHHYLAVLAIEKAGLKLEDVQFVYVKDASEGRAVFETRQVDALGSWDPFFAAVQTDLKPMTLTDGQGYSPNRTFYYANEQFAKEHPEQIRTILEEIQVSDEWANTHKDDVIKLLSETQGIEKAAIELAVKRRTYGVELFNSEIINAQQQLADTYYRIGLIPNPIKVADRMPLDAPWAVQGPVRSK